VKECHKNCLKPFSESGRAYKTALRGGGTGTFRLQSSLGEVPTLYLGLGIIQHLLFPLNFEIGKH
jgi:hypothetical protein